jgi:hypothetical protein
LLPIQEGSGGGSGGGWVAYLLSKSKVAGSSSPQMLLFRWAGMCFCRAVFVKSLFWGAGGILFRDLQAVHFTATRIHGAMLREAKKSLHPKPVGRPMHVRMRFIAVVLPAVLTCTTACFAHRDLSVVDDAGSGASCRVRGAELPE